MSDEESDPNTHKTKKCELAESYLQEYHRNWTGIETFSLCVSDSHMKCCSGSNSNGTKSLPDIGDDYITSSGLSSSSLVNCQVTEFPDKIGNNLEGPNKSSSKYLDTDHLSYRVLPKDSFEVFKTRKINAMSNKSKWITNNLESSSFLEYSDHTLETRSSQEDTRRRRKKTTRKRVMIPDNDLMKEILSKSYARTHGILSYSDMTTRNISETVDYVKSPVIDAGSMHNNSPLRTLSYLNTAPGSPSTCGKTNGTGCFVTKSLLNLEVFSKAQAPKAPSTFVVDLESEVCDKRLKFWNQSIASREPIRRAESEQSNASNKAVEVNTRKAQSNTSHEPIGVKICKSPSNTSYTKFTRARSVDDINKKQSKVSLPKSRSKISQNTPNVYESKSLSATELPKSTRSSTLPLYPVGFRPSRNESHKLINAINPNILSNVSQKLPHASKTSPSSATITLSKQQTSHTRFSERSLDAGSKKSSTSIQKPNMSIEGNSSKKSIIKQSNQLEQKISQGSFDNSVVNNGIDDFNSPKISSSKISSSFDSLSFRTSVSKFRLPNSETIETIHSSSSQHVGKVSEFLNSNVVDPESSPVTIMAESESKSNKKAKKVKKHKEPKKSTDQKGPEIDKEPKIATRGPLAHPPAVMVPGKPRCVPLVKYANPPHYKPNSPVRPRSPVARDALVVPTKPGSKNEPQARLTPPSTPPAPSTLPGPGTQPGPGTPQVPSTPPAPSTPPVPRSPPAPSSPPALSPPSASIIPPAPSTPPTLASSAALALGTPPAPGTPPALSAPSVLSALPEPGPLPAPEPLQAPGVLAPLANSVSPPTEARYATTDKAMQSGSMRLHHSITQTYDYDRFSNTILNREPSRHEYFSGSRPELNQFAQSLSGLTQPVARRSTSILSTNTFAFPVSGSENSAMASATMPSAKPSAADPPVGGSKVGKAVPDAAGLNKPLGSPLQPISTLHMLEPAISVRVPCPHERFDNTTPCPYSPFPCPHSPTCNPPCNIPCYSPPPKIPPEKPKKISLCKLKPCIDLAALEKEKVLLEKKFKAQFAEKKHNMVKCPSMCRTPPCYKFEPSKHVHTGTITEPKCASSCRTSSCNPKCRDFPWATKIQVSQQASLASVHFADDWQRQEDDCDDTRAYTSYCNDGQCDDDCLYKDASMRTDLEEKVIKVDKGLNYKQVPIYEQGRIYGRKQGASLNINSTLFPGYGKIQDPYYESGQNCAFGYELNYDRASPSYTASTYDPNCDRQYANYNQYHNYETKKGGQYYGQSSYNDVPTSNFEPCSNSYDHCPMYGPSHDQMPRPYVDGHTDVSTCDQSQNCQYYGFEDQSASEDVEEDTEKCYPYSMGTDITRHRVRVYKDTCIKGCSLKPELDQTEVELQKLKKKKKEPKGPYPEFVIPQFKHPCTPIEFGKDVCPPPACPPAKQCPFTCASRGKISGIHLRQEPIFIPKKTCDPTCKAWNTIEQSTKKDFTIWGNIPKDDDLIIVKSVDAIVSEKQQPANYRKIIDPDGLTLVERRDYMTHHSTPVLNNVFEMKQPVTVNDMRSVGKMLPQAKKEDIETSLTNMFEINFNLRVTRGDKTTEISIANEDDNDKIKTPKGSQELLVMKGECPKIIEENAPNDINIRIMIKSYKPKSENPLRERTVNDFSKEISKKFHTVSKGSKLTGTEETADHVYSVHRTTINLAPDSTDATKNDSESKDQENKDQISPKILFNSSKVTGKGDIILDKRLKTVEMGSKSLPEIDKLGDKTTEILDTYQEVTVKFSDELRQSETAENIMKFTVTSSTAKSSSLHNMDLHSILKKDDSDLKFGPSHVKVIRLYKSDANIYGTDTEPDASSYNKTSTERTDNDNKTSDDYLNLKSSEEPALEDLMLALKTSTEPTSESQQRIKEDEAILPKEDKEIIQEKKEMIKAIFEKASYLRKSKGKNRMRKLEEMLKAVLTSDSSEPDDITTSSNYLAKDLINKNLKTSFFKDSDSLNNYLILSGQESVVQVQCNTVEPASNGSGGDSEWSLETGEAKVPSQCICSAVAARLKSYDNKMTDLACCCQKSTKADKQNSCDLMPPFDEESSSVECVDVEIQNNFLSSKIVISQSVEIAAPSSNFFVIKNPIVAQAESILLRRKGSKEKKIREVRIKRSKMSITQSGVFKEYDLRKYNKSPKLGISDDDKIIFLETQPVGFPNLTKGSRKRKEKTRTLNWQQPADILQLYETKKAVLEIYTEKTVTEDGERLVAKLPKFVYEKESEICKNYENSQSNCKGFRSLCKTNIVMMSFTR